MGALLLLNIIPCALVTVCLFQFFIPVSLNQAGTNPATIGRVFMLFCVVVMFLGRFAAALWIIRRTRNASFSPDNWPGC